MFVLSVSCLMAQGVFTYQAVVYNDNGDSLVVDQDVIATVTITDDASHTYTQDPQTVHTSLNGLAVLSIGDASNPQFKNMDWATAKITVDFKVGSSTVMAVAEEQIPAVPYAIKAETKITTPMVRDYVQKATIDDVERIINAMSPQLQEDLLGAIVDTAIDNFELAKEIFLYYVQHAEAEDAQRLFNAMVSNPNRVEIMDALAGYLLDTLETADGKEMMVSLLENYVTNLKASEVEKILGAIPENVRNTVADSAIRVLLKWKITEGSTTVLDPDIKDALKEIAKNYLAKITFEEVEAMVHAVESNNDADGAMPVLQNQFNIWMNEYVETLVKRYMISDYYYCETGEPRNVCGGSTSCFNTGAELTFENPSNTGFGYVLRFSVPFTGSNNPVASDLYVTGGRIGTTVLTENEITTENWGQSVGTNILTVYIKDGAFPGFDISSMEEGDTISVQFEAACPGTTPMTFTGTFIYHE